MAKTNDQALADVKKVEEQIKKSFPDYEWEDVAMWMQTPKDLLFGKSPLQICATEDITPLINWLKDRSNEKK